MIPIPRQPLAALVPPDPEYKPASTAPQQPAHEFLALSVFALTAAPPRAEPVGSIRRTESRRRKWRVGDFP